MQKTIVAMQRDGVCVQVFAMNFEVPDGDFDLRAAVKAACTEYCQTKEGRETYEGNCNNFNWGDFDAYVPDELCEKHGFKRLRTEVSDEVVDFDELLVDDDDVFLDEDMEEMK